MRLESSDHSRNVADTAVKNSGIRRLYSDVGTAPHCDPDIRFCESWASLMPSLTLATVRP